MEKIVTFAVPAYNAEKYLKKCLSTFLSLEQRELFEVIVINDGSHDDTALIAQEYVLRCPGTFRLINKENGGHGSGINVASAEACGRYFKVVDADDWILPENFPRYLQALQASTADVIINEFQRISYVDGHAESVLFSHAVPQAPIDRAALREYYPYVRDCCTFHGITYRTEFYRSVGYSLAEKVFYEDQEYALIPFAQAQSFLLLRHPLYQYLVNNSAQSVSIQNQVKNIGQVEVIIRRILSYWKGHLPMPEEQEFLFQEKTATLCASYFAIALVKNPARKQGWQQAEHMVQLLDAENPVLLEKTARKRKTMVLFHKCRLPATLYETMLRSALYRRIKFIWLR